MSMVTTVTMNPCIDLTVRVPSFEQGKLNICADSRTDISGKGVNVAIVLKELGISTVCTGISFSEGGGRLAEMLDTAGIPHDFVMSEGNLRTNIKLVDLSKNEMSEINSPGDPVSGAVLSGLMKKIDYYAPKSDIIVFSGRIPNGAEDSVYRDCLESANRYGIKTVLDAGGAPLRLALEAKPYIIKPNIYELEQAFGIIINSVADIMEISRKIIADGIQIVCCSMGGDGAVIADEVSAFYAPAPDVVPKGFQGAGDSMVAGMCKAICEGGSIEEMLVYGMTAAAGSIIREGTLLCQRENFEKFSGRIKADKL